MKFSGSVKTFSRRVEKDCFSDSYAIFGKGW